MVWALGFGGLGFRVWGLGFKGFRVWGFGFRALSFKGFRVQGLGSRLRHIHICSKEPYACSSLYEGPFLYYKGPGLLWGSEKGTLI